MSVAGRVQAAHDAGAPQRPSIAVPSGLEAGLDVNYRLEQAFGIKIPQGELFPEGVSQDPRFVQNGMVTPEGIAAMKARLPHVDFSNLEKDPRVTQVSRLFTVDTLVGYVERKLASK